MGILLQFLATKALAPILGGIVLLTMGERPVELSKPRIYMSSDTLYFSTQINNAFPDELIEIIKSDIPVTFRLNITAIRDTAILHTVRYDIERMVYVVKRDEDSDGIETDDEKEMRKLVSEFSDIGVPKEKIPLTRKLEIRVSMDKVTLEFLDDEEFDLMTLWNYRSPQRTIEVKKEDFE
jgi:hypothetical protein